MLRVAIDSALLKQVPAAMEATSTQVYAARTRALIKLRTHVETVLKREAAKKLNLPQRAIGNRFFSNSITAQDDVLRVWFGEWAISPYAIGTPVQNSRGVRVGRRSYRGAFMGSVYTNQQKVWIRLHSRHFSRDLYPTNYRPGDRGRAGNRGRFPVVRAAVPVEGVMEEIVEVHEDGFADFFEKTFLRELNYQANVKGTR